MRTVKISQEGWLERGFKRGLVEGKAEGKAEGKVEGKAEGLEEVAVRMLEAGMSIEVIRRATGLKRTELTKLKKKRA